MVQGGVTCIKYLMFVFNFVFVICGIALIAIGVIVQAQDFTYFLNSQYVTAPTILIVVGCVVFVLAFLGCCGAARESNCMIMTFGILLFLIILVEISGGIAAFINKGELENVLKENMNSTLQQEKIDAKKIWDEMQIKWSCCGVESFKDYMHGIPKSCCAHEIETCSAQTAYKIGCYDKMLNKIKGAMGIVGGVAIAFAVVELIGVIFSWCLASAIQKGYEGV